jgi:putative acetyltransferase
MAGNAKQEKITSIRIRPEEPRDYDVVYEINRWAFDSLDEAESVNKVRYHVGPVISLIAEINSQIVGHIMFFPVKIVGDINEWEAIGFGPVAVLPKYQRQGTGSSLIYAGLSYG